MIDPKLEVTRYEMGNNNKVKYDGVLLSRNVIETIPEDCFMSRPERIDEIQKAGIFEAVGGGKYRILVERGTEGVCQDEGLQETDN